MTMTGRFVNDVVRIAAAIALLLAVMSSPTRPSKPFAAPSGPNGLSRNFALPKMGVDCGDLASYRSSVTQSEGLLADVEDELDAEREDDLDATPRPSRTRFDVFSSPCSETHRELIGCAAGGATRPLRC